MSQARYSDDQLEPRDELDLQHELAKSSRGNALLRNTNLGSGNYDEDTLWQQIRSYRKGLFAYVAFGNLLTKRAFYETKFKLGRDGFSHYNESRSEVETFEGVDEDDVPDDRSSWNVIRERGKEIWEALGEKPAVLTEKQIAAVIKKTGVEPDQFLPIYWQMVSGRHDASKSRDAELLRDFLTDKKHLGDDAQEASSLFGGRNR